MTPQEVEMIEDPEARKLAEQYLKDTEAP